MQHNRLQIQRRPVMLAGGFVAAISLATCLFLSTPARVSAQDAAKVVDPSQYLYDVAQKGSFTFQSPQTCSTENCHEGAAGAVKQYKVREVKTDSLTLWSASGATADPHHTAYKTLSKPKAVEIGKKMGYAKKPVATAECISCHSLNPPAALLKPVKDDDPKLKVSDGVSCNACHGPSSKWRDLHDKEKDAADSWATRLLKADGHKKLLDETGLYDTRPLLERSQRCVSCHLAIDSKMVAAGHPQPKFEMNWFSFSYPSRHWNDPHDAKDHDAPFFQARLWAAGQVVALHDAFEQLAERAENKAADAELVGAYNQAMSYYTVFSPAVSAAGPIKADMAAANKAITDARTALVAKNAAGLATAARAAAAEVAKLYEPVRSYEPDQASTLKLAKGVAAQAAAADEFGVEQQRGALFALYSAYAASPGAAPTAAATVKTIQQKFFPKNEEGKYEIKPADFKAALAEVKTAIGS